MLLEVLMVACGFDERELGRKPMMFEGDCDVTSPVLIDMSGLDKRRDGVLSRPFNTVGLALGKSLFRTGVRRKSFLLTTYGMEQFEERESSLGDCMHAAVGSRLSRHLEDVV